MSRGAMNKDVKYYCTGCQEKEQELAELKAKYETSDNVVVPRYEYVELVGKKDDLQSLKHKIWGLQQMVEFQTADEGLWLVTTNVVIAYLQQELRKLHHCIEQACKLANTDSKEEE